MVSEGKEYREIWKVEEKEKKREVVEIRKRIMVSRKMRVRKKEMDRRLKINETDLWEFPVIMVEGLGDGRVSGREEMMSGAEGFGGCPSTATKDYEAHSMEFLMKTKNKEEKLEIVRRKAKFDMACYVDPEGLSGGLAL